VLGTEVFAPLSVIAYQKRMDAVDYMDTVVSATSIGMEMCKKRCSRVIFCRYVAVSFHNAKVAAETLFDDKKLK
jgi:hypothetical protein